MRHAPYCFVTVAFAVSGLSSCGQGSASHPATAAQPSPGKAVVVPGTHVALQLPPGFKLSTSVNGIERDGDTGINVVDLAGGNFYKNTRTFDSATFAAQGLQVLSYQATRHAGYPAKYATLQANADTRSQVLVFGDTTFSVMLTGLYPTGDQAVGEQIKQALLSSTYNKQLVLNPLALAPFQVQPNASRFKFASYSGAMYTYTTGGSNFTTSGDKAAVVVLPLPASSESPETFAHDILERLVSNGLTEHSVRHESYARLNGYEAYEAEVYGQLKGKPTLFYILYLASGERALFMQGITTDSYAKSLQDFRAFGQALRFKPQE